MNDRLLYHTSIDSKIVSPFAPLLKKIDYYTSLQSTDIALNNLKKLNSRLDENNIVTLAYLANNPHINNEDREKYEKQMIHFLKVEQTRLEELKERIKRVEA
jgi:hypothetical protein